MPQGKRLFIKDIIHYLLPPMRQPVSIAPSLLRVKRGVGTEEDASTNGVNGHHVNGHTNGANGHTNGVNGYTNGVNGHSTNGTTNGTTTKDNPPLYPFDTLPEPGNPTVMPKSIMSGFHFAFLIRDPHYSVPSYYRCTIPPLDDVTGFHNYDPSEAGYDEVRRVFEYLRRARLVGPHLATRPDEIVDEVNGELKPVSIGKGIKPKSSSASYESGIDICVVDADEMLRNPGATMREFCRSTGIEFDPGMLNWDNQDDYRYACEAFEKWRGFHNDVIESGGLNTKEPVGGHHRLLSCPWRYYERKGNEANWLP